MVKNLRAPKDNRKPAPASSSGVCDDVADFDMNSRSLKKFKLPESAVVQFGLQHYSDNSELCQLPGFKDKVAVMMMAHNAKPSLFYMHRDSFGGFLSETQSITDDFPSTKDEFEKRYEMRFVMASNPPVQKQIPYARGAYVKFKVVSKVIEVFDSYFAWRQAKNVHGSYPDVKIHISSGIGLQLSTEVEYECNIVVTEVGKRVDVPFSPFAIPGPAWSKQHAEMTFEVLNQNELRIRFQGDTYSFRNNFSSLGVPGRYEKQNGEPLPDDAKHEEKKQGSFVRLIKKWDVRDKVKSKYLLEMIEDTVYENTMVAVFWKGCDEEKNPVTDFKEELLKLGNVYYLD